MKKILLTSSIIFMMAIGTVNAQNYKTGVGLGIDFGNGSTLVGPQIKHFFSQNSAINGQVLFGNNYTMLAAYYQYHGGFNSTRNLQWYLGVGPSLGLYKGGSDFFIRPMTGLDFKIPDAPIAMSFDWRPMLYLGNNSDFEPGRFGIGFNYTLN